MAAAGNHYLHTPSGLGTLDISKVRVRMSQDPLVCALIRVTLHSYLVISVLQKV